MPVEVGHAAVVRPLWLAWFAVTLRPGGGAMGEHDCAEVLHAFLHRHLDGRQLHRASNARSRNCGALCVLLVGNRFGPCGPSCRTWMAPFPADEASLAAGRGLPRTVAAPVQVEPGCRALPCSNYHCSSWALVPRFVPSLTAYVRQYGRHESLLFGLRPSRMFHSKNSRSSAAPSRHYCSRRLLRLHVQHASEGHCCSRACCVHGRCRLAADMRPLRPLAYCTGVLWRIAAPPSHMALASAAAARTWSRGACCASAAFCSASARDRRLKVVSETGRECPT